MAFAGGRHRFLGAGLDMTSLRLGQVYLDLRKLAACREHVGRNCPDVSN